MKHRTGGWRWVRARGKVAARDAEGRATRVAGTMTDVTDLRALADQRLASERFTAVGTLAAGVAHEINNPLAVIAANVQIAMELLPPEADGPLEALRRAQALIELAGEVVALGQLLGQVAPRVGQMQDAAARFSRSVLSRITASKRLRSAGACKPASTKPRAISVAAVMVDRSTLRGVNGPKSVKPIWTS